ncbi:metallophosphoesterase [Phytomonospora endophytica]|uniref:3',5'-cyclic AMP phosphodiesterase CpdA n=1 Tax=Phytomonospora endophytica TaxID=714109 RepID=A0A841FP40_9ACTN|nr:metallophosphoesterase [Phytomonospora endophytica]MBB6035322.1 3',5'-cyclic AMP phosphodiesterase CpdA [Phytomonospora endophytica]GIG63928.1 3',5'-cyclic adenosine monophosphate phosphodiesterase CpdA [Phytomonospora endophytica]
MTRILHLSDPHLSRGGGPDADGVDATASLDLILHAVRHVPGIDLVLVTGDIADDGTPEACEAVRDRVGRFAAQRDVPHVYTTGNHDTRGAFAAVFGTGHLDAGGRDVGVMGTGVGHERAAVSHVGGPRVVTLDSLVPGETHGELSDAQLSWLRELLAETAEAGTVVALHHPPVAPAVSPLLPTVNLRDAERLGRVIAGTDVQTVLCGHFHLQLSALWHGIPVWVTPGIITRIDLSAPPGLERAVKGAGATVVELGGPYSPMFHTIHARDPEAGRQVYLVDAMSGEDVDRE